MQEEDREGGGGEGGQGGRGDKRRGFYIHYIIVHTLRTGKV